MFVRIKCSLHLFIILQSTHRSCKLPIILRFPAKIHAFVSRGPDAYHTPRVITQDDCSHCEVMCLSFTSFGATAPSGPEPPHSRSF